MKDKIIYVEFFPNCRLANQMCQFAAGYALHKKYPEFDLKVYNGYMADSNKMFPEDIYPIFNKMIDPYLCNSIPDYCKIIPEGLGEPIPYDEIDTICKTNNFIRLQGFFQGEYWFWGVPNNIIKEKFIGSNYCYIYNIVNKYGDLNNTVGIHIRRTDYLNSTELLRVPKFSWYIKAYIKYFPGKDILVASDDIEWCKKRFEKYSNYINISYCDESPESTIYILSKCKGGFIGSNSTFSWWGAWLGDDGNHDIVFPDEYFNHSTHHTKEEGYKKPDIVVCDRWIHHPMLNEFEK